MRLQLDDLFIAPALMFFDHAIAEDNFFDDLESTVRYRQQILGEFEKTVSKIVQVKKK